MSEKILVIGADDPYFGRVYEALAGSGLSVAAYLSHYPLPGESKLRDLPRIDASCLYHASRVASAGPTHGRFSIDRAYHQSMLACERDFMSTLDRLSAKPLSMGERKRLFRELLGFYKAFFETHRGITHVFFPKTPHFGWDVVLFHVARQLGIATLILQRTDLSRLFVLRADWHDEIRLGREEIGRSNPPSASILALLEGDSPVVRYSKSLNAHIKSSVSAPTRANFVANGVKAAGRWTRLLARLYKSRRNRWADSAFYCNPPLSTLEKLACYVTKYSRNKRCLATYASLSSAPDIGAPFLYYAMHFQPERSTQPEGMEYEDQYLAIATLAAALPDGWLLFVKEHPRQFDSWPPDLRKMHARTPEHYAEIARLEGVTLIPADVDSDFLVSHARISCTVTGSTGWEALKRGKPAIVFGHVWYSACASCAVVSDVQGAASAIASLSAKSSAQVADDVRAYLGALEPHLVSCFPGTFLERPSDAEYDALVDSLASSVVATVRGTRRAL